MADPLRSLVLFVILLALAGFAVSTAYYYPVELPLRNAGQPPYNGDASWHNYGMTICMTCYDECLKNPSNTGVNCLEKCRQEGMCSRIDPH